MPVETGTGLITNARTTSTNTAVFVNGTSYASSSTVSVAQINSTSFIMARNNGGSSTVFSLDQYSLAFYGSGAIDQSLLHADVSALATALGW